MDDKRETTEKVKVLDNYCDKLTRSGYNVEQSRIITSSGIRYHQKKVKEAKNEGKTINRNMRCSHQRLKKLVKNKTDKVMWYKPNPDKNNQEEPTNGGESSTSRRSTTQDRNNKPDLRKTIAVLHLPRTPDGLLLREVSKAETQLRLVCSTKVKIKESW